MTRVSLAGLWADPGLLSVVLGQGQVPAGHQFDVTETGLARLNHWLVAMGQDRIDDDRTLSVTQGPDQPLELLIALAEVIMGYFPDVDPARLARRRQHIEAQAWSRRRSLTEAAACELRHGSGPDDIAVQRRTQPYADYFAVEEIEFAHTKFVGGKGRVLRRAVFVSGDAVTVLPYDPRRDLVLLVEQLRSGPLVRGDRNPWQLEAVAGRIDPGETPQQAALREAVEEAGLHLAEDGLRHIADYYPSPGTSAEMLHSYLALADLPDGISGIHGLDSEDEDIKGHLVPFDQLMQLVQTGEIGNASTILSALWLVRERPALRG